MLDFQFDDALLSDPSSLRGEVASLNPELDRLRDELCVTDVKMVSGQLPIPQTKQPLDIGFYLSPPRLLEDYQQDRQGSLLARVLAATKRLMAEVDRVVVLGGGSVFFGSKALFEACCQPYFNELTRGERGSKPRIYFEGHSLDNDAMAGLLHFLGAHREREVHSVDESWGVVVIEPNAMESPTQAVQEGVSPEHDPTLKSARLEDAPQGLETVAGLNHVLQALLISCGGDQQRAARRILCVSRADSSLDHLAKNLGCRDIFDFPTFTSGNYAALSVTGLLPAALMGINVMRLLEGARAINLHFQATKAPDNLVLRYAGIHHIWNSKFGRSLRTFNVWNRALESTGQWYSQLVSESLAKQEDGPVPGVCVGSRDRNSHVQQHLDGSQDKLMTHLWVEGTRYDPLLVGQADDGVNNGTWPNETSPQEIELAKTGWAFPGLAKQHFEATRSALRARNRPMTCIEMPKLDEFYLGQLMQTLMLATVIEARLLRVHPFGSAFSKAR